MRKGKKKRKDKLMCNNGSVVHTSSSFGRIELVQEFLPKKLWMQ